MSKKKPQVSPAIIPQEKKTVPPPLSFEEAQKHACDNLLASCDPRNIERDIVGVMNKARVHEGHYKLEGKEVEISNNFAVMNNLENHYLLSECFDDRHRPFVMKFARELVKEYNCKTASEKALVQVAVAAFNRILKSSRAFNFNCFTDTISDLKNNFVNIHSKELDRANRQFLAAIQALQQMKRPQIKLNVHADTAYLAQNQQINTKNQKGKVPPNDEQNEIIDQQ